MAFEDRGRRGWGKYKTHVLLISCIEILYFLVTYDLFYMMLDTIIKQFYDNRTTVLNDDVSILSKILVSKFKHNG